MNNSLIKEAENIINEYIKENRYSILPETRGKARTGFRGKKVLLNTAINILLLGSIAFLIFIVSRLF